MIALGCLVFTKNKTSSVYIKSGFQDLMLDGSQVSVHHRDTETQTIHALTPLHNLSKLQNLKKKKSYQCFINDGKMSEGETEKLILKQHLTTFNYQS